ncbi:MAG: SDR family NAD(P)-dependent oxidoreductase [Planctomycetota bacterium]
MRIIITGATSGIGRGLAVHYAEQGHIVGAIARRANLLEELQSECGPSIVPLPTDLRDGPGLKAAINSFAEQQGGLDLVYANAGVGQHAPEEGWDPEKARQITEINVVGSLNTLTAAARVMVAQGSGRLVGISSLAAQCPLPASAAYGASKQWMVFYLRSLAMDLEPQGVFCTVVMPGYVPTALADGQFAANDALLTPGARRAAKLIATRVARGDSTIRFPRKISVLSRVAMLTPPAIRARHQRKRLARRQAARTATDG